MMGSRGRKLPPHQPPMSYFSPYPPGCTPKDIDDFYGPDDEDCDSLIEDLSTKDWTIMTRFHSLPDNHPHPPMTTPTSLTSTASLLGVTPRQRPCLDRFDDLMGLAEATARAIDDNAWDEGQPLPKIHAYAWLKQLDNIRQAIHNATGAHPFESEKK